MVYKKCGSKMVSEDDQQYVEKEKNKARYIKQAWHTMILAILINGILIIGSYNYAQYLAYRENVQVIKPENYKTKQRNMEQRDIQSWNMSQIVYLK